MKGERVPGRIVALLSEDVSPLGIEGWYDQQVIKGLSGAEIERAAEKLRETLDDDHLGDYI